MTMTNCPTFSGQPAVANDVFAVLRTIKLFDPLSNRYHIGLIREEWGGGMSLDFPLTSQLQEGQAVRYIVAGEPRLVARREMHNALITRTRPCGRTTQVELMVHPAVAAA